MSVIASLEVLLSASTSGLSRGFKKAESLTKGFNSKVSKLVAGPSGVGGAIGGALAGVSVAAGIKYAVGEYQKIEEANTRLQNAFKATNGAAGLSVGQVTQYAQKLSQTTRFSAAATTEAAAGLAKFQSIKGANFTESIKQAQNLATVMGKDLTSASTELGHALQNPKLGYLELAKAGVMFSEEQIDAIQSMQEAGDIAGAQKVILEALAQQYEGAAEAAGETLSGKLDILHNTFSNLASVVGEAVAPAIKGAIDLMQGWLAGLDQNELKAQSWRIMAKVVGFVADYVQLLGIGWKAAKVAAAYFIYGTVKGLAFVVAGVEAALNALRKLAGLSEMSIGAKSLEEFATGAKQAAQDEAKELEKAWLAPDASKAVDQFFNNAKAKNDTAMAAIADGAKKAGDALKNGPGKAMKQLSEKAIAAQEEVTRLIEELRLSNKYFGMDDKQRKIAELKDKGATAGQVAEASKLSHQLRGKEIAQEIETPFEKFQREMSKLTATFEGGGLDGATFEKARAKLTKELQTSLPEHKASAGGALSASGAEARSAILNYRNAQRSADPAVQLKRVAEDQLEQQKQANVWLRQLIKNQPQVAALAGL